MSSCLREQEFQCGEWRQQFRRTIFGRFRRSTVKRDRAIVPRLWPPYRCSSLPGRAERMPVPERHAVLGTPLRPPFSDGFERSIFAMGCFWGAECIYWEAPGVHTTAVGYVAGHTPNVLLPINHQRQRPAAITGSAEGLKHGPVGCPCDGDRHGLVDPIGCLIQPVKAVDRHTAALFYSPVHVGRRFSRKADMPSCASLRNALSVMTSVARW